MSKSKHTVAGLLVGLLKPVADAWKAETGREFDGAKLVKTAARAVRTWCAGVLRKAATAIEPKPEPGAALVVEPVAVPVAEPSATLQKVETAPTTEVAVIVVVPVAEPTTVKVAPATVNPLTVEAAPKPTRKPRKPAQAPKASTKPAMHRERLNRERGEQKPTKATPKRTPKAAKAK